jgi:decaprenylphospho-beta-D-erythro-pentofuranosid-2-ulose 2-reductase
MRIVISAATSAIAHQCALVWAAGSNVELELIARDKQKLEGFASDIAVRYPQAKVNQHVIDFEDAQAIGSLAQELAKSPIDVVLIAQGSLTDQPRAQADFGYLKSELSLNAISPMLFAEAFAEQLAKQGSGKLAIIGSVAGDRGRASNYAYGATKAALDAFAAGMQQRFAGSSVSVSIIKPGPTKTPMTSGLNNARMASAESVAKVIVAGVGARKRVIYAPKQWALIMFVVRLIPFGIFKRLNF